jgi:hypothetical protein
VLLLAFAGALLVAQREQLRRRTPAALVAVSFMAFAVLSAAMTAWARANFDQCGVSNANASRYTLFGSYFCVGLILFLASLGPEALHHPIFTRWLPVCRQPAMVRTAFVLFLILSTVSFARSVKVYRSAGELNSRVIAAYLAQPADPLLESSIFPNPDFVVRLKKDLQWHHLGPYRDLTQAALTDPVVFTSAINNANPEPVNRTLTSSFTCPVDVVTGIDILLYTYAQRNSGYCQLDVLDESDHRLAWSRTDASALLDGTYQTFAFNDLAGICGHTVRLVLTYHADPQSPGIVAALCPKNAEATFKFRVRGKNDPAVEFARRAGAASK